VVRLNSVHHPHTAVCGDEWHNKFVRSLKVSPIRIRSGTATQPDVRYRMSDEMSGDWITVCDIGTSKLGIGTAKDRIYRIAGMLFRSGEGPG